MSVLHCSRCDALFDTDGSFMTVNVVSGDNEEVIVQALLCSRCIRSVGSTLTLETIAHRHPN